MADGWSRPIEEEGSRFWVCRAFRLSLTGASALDALGIEAFRGLGF